MATFVGVDLVEYYKQTIYLPLIDYYAKGPSNNMEELLKLLNFVYNLDVNLTAAYAADLHGAIDLFASLVGIVGQISRNILELWWSCNEAGLTVANPKTVVISNHLMA